MSERRASPVGWPDGKRAAVIFNIAYEAWEADGSPGISPMGNPPPVGVPDIQAQEWGQLRLEERHLAADGSP
jgi:hypothetical protein